ncbi:hypothetical protein HRG_011704 [Hirsutella rhossiliensis]|uniref:Uncharacterized protein n=1 Tax=Hirsutella rhossiliensis TaxID=111463 RepID=A0A9P8SDB2_9HYPO|nr:uncharacterized protein HRG_11704 [Hirsutella rhossiliensis]KAH0957155.1 hypothetical protein HRG_11704 [Hirsutella rhossiliensis]
MSSSPSADSSAPHLRKPLATSKGAGGDMSMMFFAQPDCPARFAHQDEHRIRGLNAEAIARVLLPVPSWLLESEYAPLRAEGDDLGPSLFFSLNLSIYGQPVVDTDWSEQWFFMSGRVHPYALSWEVERRDGLEAGPDDAILYTVPALIVRDQGYQPVLPRSLASSGQFPSTPPVVSFHGVVAGPGLDLLRRDFLPGLGPDQLRCCGFVRLTTYIALACRTGFHSGLPPLRGLCYLSVYVNPWAVLCKKIAEKSNSSFLPGVPFTCTGKVVGLLDHRVMLSPPGSERDYVFIIVPDSWTFVDRPSAAAAASASPLATPLRRQTPSASSTFDSVRAALYSVAAPASAASVPPSSASAPIALDPVTPPPKRSHPALADTPMKRARLLQLQHSPPSSSSNTVGSAAPSSSPPSAASSSRPDGAPPAPAPTASPGCPLDSIIASTSDPPARPLRYRMQK